MDPQKIQNLLHHFETRLNYFQSILDYAKELNHLAKNADFSLPENLERLSTLLENRENLMPKIEQSGNAIKTIIGELSPNQPVTSLDQLLHLLPPGEAALIQEQTKATESIIKETASLDISTRQELLNKQLAVKDQILKLYQSMDANRAYRATPRQHEGFFFDKT